MNFSVATYEEDSAQIVTVEGEFDIAAAEPVEDALVHAQHDGGKGVVLDLRGVTFMDSTGLRVVLSAHGRAEEAGQTLTIVRGPEVVQRVFRLARLEERLVFADEPLRGGA